MRRLISSTGSTAVPVTSTPPTLNCGPSTTTMRMTARAFARSIWTSVDSTRAWI